MYLCLGLLESGAPSYFIINNRHFSLPLLFLEVGGASSVSGGMAARGCGIITVESSSMSTEMPPELVTRKAYSWS
jgi:hypothetical protein